ncbi:MAG TPA: ATP synthase F0 subunit B [Deferrisomatales bacterium]|nr:ATP synthase F0 subunit B [Deferrisomatales bacterium]
MAYRFPGKTVFTTACLLALPALAAASAGGSGRDPWTDLGLKFVNFSILAGGLFYFLRKPVRQALADRHENVRKALEDARKAKEDAQAKVREYGQRVANLEQEISAIRDQVQAEAERQKNQIIAEAQAAADSIRRQAAAAGTNEVKRAQDALRGEVVELAMQLAQELLAKGYTAQDQKKAVQQTIENVEGIH